jgi:hypothetical protein
MVAIPDAVTGDNASKGLWFVKEIAVSGRKIYGFDASGSLKIVHLAGLPSPCTALPSRFRNAARSLYGRNLFPRSLRRLAS